MWIYVFWSCICVFLYMCICVFAILDTHNYHLWGPVLSRNHCRQTFILYIRVYMPFADCTLLRSRGGGAIVLKVHLSKLPLSYFGLIFFIANINAHCRVNIYWNTISDAPNINAMHFIELRLLKCHWIVFLCDAETLVHYSVL